MTSDDEILRLQPQMFAIVPESLAPYLEKVLRLLYDKRFQSYDLFDFAMFPFAILT